MGNGSEDWGTVFKAFLTQGVRALGAHRGFFPITTGQDL
jgi:hypothetical protein